MVRCVKRLKKILKNAKLTYEELLTVVVEIECMLNSRPLTDVSSEDRVEPLTPSHLLTGRRLLFIPDESIDAEEESRDVEILTRRQRYVTLLLSHFWSRWKREYVLELRLASLFQWESTIIFNVQIKYRIYLEQFDFFHFLRDAFQGDLETG